MRRWLRRLAFVAGALPVVLAIGFAATSGGFASLGSPAPEIGRSPQYADGHFENTRAVAVMNPGQSWRTLKEWAANDREVVPHHALPHFARTTDVLATRPASGLRLTWFGHSTVLVELDGVRVLTDPIWSARASPSTIAGPHRFSPPAIRLSALPSLDAVVVSHDHYDHLDMATVKALAATGVAFYVPLGVGSHLRRWHVPDAQIHELDWWQAAVVRGVQLTSVPAQHFSGRAWAHNPTLWTSWTLVGPAHRIFFSGDTGLHDTLPAIADRLGPFDVALVEIGQWHPSWGSIHLGPDGALEAVHRLRATTLLPIHWGAFALGLHGWSEPAEDVFTRAGHVRVLTPLLGEPIEPVAWTVRAPWWRELDRAAER